jgi:hypothetical protein
MGHKGGSETAKRGSEYFRQLAAKRKTMAWTLEDLLA